ncbi:MAG: Y-family DNA polymerase [Gammaproteobacteria bacterium]|nr:Y-family DNA polymerase [Gammaproteobacteria bacterium]MCP4090229.1 Y-family DNA polymerase [Gammaproteobacteria bacterium]MCP4832657.1 Y-family DNA polymerase [Gammaproteobacteria bacterium]MCP4930101.1 Y-family DNA polymerase [Gammaproteobacteria bacterium]
MFALVDCNSFFASCEQVFRPDLRGKPVVVLSNNDGFIVARSKEAKELGIGDLQTFFKVKHLLRKHKVAVFSSNYPLYGDMSNRVMQGLQSFSPNIEIYSIDEMFLSFHHMPFNLHDYANKIKNQTWEHTRIPVSVGIAPTKTLAKIANHAAKKIPQCQGTCVMDKPHKWEWYLRRIPVTAIWGVAKRLARRLEPLQIHTAWDLASADPKAVRRISSINLERTIKELNGTPCLTLDELQPARQQIYCTRSFGKKATELQPVLEGISLYAARAAEKLRAQHHLVSTIHVFMHTSPFQSNYHYVSDVIQLPYPTDDTRQITAAARQAITQLYRPGHAFLKAGIGLIEITDRQHHQFDLLCVGQPVQTDKLMRVLDCINQQQGKGTIFIAAQGINKPWYMRQQYTSPQYTTKWQDIPVATC